MELLWVPFSFAGIFLWGVGQVFAKETRSDVHSSNLLLLFAANIAVINIAYWLLFGHLSSGGDRGRAFRSRLHHLLRVAQARKGECRGDHRRRVRSLDRLPG